MNRIPLTAAYVKHTLLVLFCMASPIASAASQRQTHEQDAPKDASTHGVRGILRSAHAPVVVARNRDDDNAQKTPPASMLLTANSKALGYYTFEPHATGSRYLQAQVQAFPDQDATDRPRSDRSLRNDITTFASTVATPAPDAAPVALTALGLIGVAWRARLKSRPNPGAKAPG
jgi:hypothetical protein